MRDHKEGWALKNWCFQIMVLEETLQNPLDCKDVKLVNPKGNQSWIFIGRTGAEAEAQILWPPRCWERLKAKEERGRRGWDGWIASLTQWAWMWGNPRKQWKTEEPGVLQSMRSQRVGHNLATEQQQHIQLNYYLQIQPLP